VTDVGVVRGKESIIRDSAITRRVMGEYAH
jgi:hypothetical protein